MAPKFSFTTHLHVSIEDAQDGDLLAYVLEDGQAIYQRVTSNSFGTNGLWVDTRWLPKDLLEVCQSNARRIVDEEQTKNMQQLRQEHSRESLLRLISHKIQTEGLLLGGGNGMTDSTVEIGVPLEINMHWLLDYSNLDLADLNNSPSVELDVWYSSSPLKTVMPTTEQEVRTHMKFTN